MNFMPLLGVHFHFHPPFTEVALFSVIDIDVPLLLSSKFHPRAPVLFQLLRSFVLTDSLSITLLLTFTPYFDFHLTVQYALDAFILEDVTFDLSFLSKCSLNSLLYFIVNSSNNLFTMRIGNSSPRFSTHALSNTAFSPCPVWKLFLPGALNPSSWPFLFALFGMSTIFYAAIWPFLYIKLPVPFS